MFKPLYFIFFHALLRTLIWDSFTIQRVLKFKTFIKEKRLQQPAQRQPITVLKN
ncbi:hypothetical protein QFZ80_007158 [Paenibacillus sp. V4I7]|nr:hypothetical protein [Paenibacillus sp. V4I7]